MDDPKAEQEKIPTLAELVKAKMDREEALKPRVRKPREPRTFLWWVGAIVVGFVLLTGSGEIARNIFFTNQTSPLPSNANYSLRICDDAYKTNQPNENVVDHFEIVLHEGCYSGFVTYPAKWNTWLCQMKGDNADDWVSPWYRGWQEPRIPLSAHQFNSNENMRVMNNVPTHQVRLQGKGTYLCYQTAP